MEGTLLMRYLEGMCALMTPCYWETEAEHLKSLDKILQQLKPAGLQLIHKTLLLYTEYLIPGA